MIQDGLVVVWKEAGWTSFDVVAKLRRILGTRKAGHTGTLDPQAEGVLPAAFGKGTKAVSLMENWDKSYRAVLRLGVITDTQDMTGSILEKREYRQITRELFEEKVLSFEGEQMQIPPMYSALKVRGKKLYELAREGIEIPRQPRPVVFHSLRICSFEPPFAEIEAVCSKGTYIRTLCHDIGTALGCGAAMERLVRTRVGPFEAEEAHRISELESAKESGRLDDCIISLEKLFSQYPAYRCKTGQDRYLLNGNRIACSDPPVPGLVRMYTSGGVFAGLYRWDTEKGEYRPEKMFIS